MGDCSAVTGSSQDSSHSDAQCAPCEIPMHPLWDEGSPLKSQGSIACRGARAAESLRVSHGIWPSACRVGTGRGGVGPLELELDLLLVPFPLVLYVELGAGGHIDSLPGDLDLEPLARLQCIGKPAQLRHELRGGVNLLDVPVWLFAHSTSLFANARLLRSLKGPRAPAKSDRVDAGVLQTG